MYSKPEHSQLSTSQLCRLVLQKLVAHHMLSGSDFFYYYDNSELHFYCIKYSDPSLGKRPQADVHQSQTLRLQIVVNNKAPRIFVHGCTSYSKMYNE